MAQTGRSAALPGVDSIDRVLAFLRANIEKVADEVRPIEAGLVVRSPSLPAVWAINHMRLAVPLAFAPLVDLADQQLAECRYVQIVVENQDAGPGLERAFREAGWKTDREVLMVLTAAPDRDADTGVVTDVGEDEVLELMKRWYAEDELARLALDELTEYSRREARACGDRMLGVRSSDGQLVATTKLRSDGSTAQVEDVYTVPEARGRGYARALVSRAVELARADGHDLIFITADDNDWPKELYARIGFRRLAQLWPVHLG
jgi:GNAT superfamily N-acetyltransferase